VRLYSDRTPVIRHSKSRKVSEDLFCGHWRSAISNSASRIHLAQFPGRHLDTKIEAQIQDASIPLSQGQRRHFRTIPQSIATRISARHYYALQRHARTPVTSRIFGISSHGRCLVNEDSQIRGSTPSNFVSRHGFAHIQSVIRTQKSTQTAYDATQSKKLRCRRPDMWISAHYRPWFLETSLHIPGGAARTKVLDQTTLHPCC
jgi:hypothetical protein